MMRTPSPHPVRCGLRRGGFTLLELVIVIAVIGLLVSLILPAVQQARETARRATCQNHLRQLAVAMTSHESQQRRFPSNGWGYLWVGDPDRGTDERQPGGWIYNLLDYVEQSPLRGSGTGLSGTGRRAALSQMMQRPLPVFRCPSRPGGDLTASSRKIVPYNADWAADVAKTDYAVNEGDFITDTRGGPPTLSDGDSRAYPWRDTRAATGICFQRSRIRTQDIRDGMSNTYMLGEKYVNSEDYSDAHDLGHDQSMYCGVDLDINRWTLNPPLQDAPFPSVREFGSAHEGGCHFAMCDGSVRVVAYSIDREVHRAAGTRWDR